MGNSVTRHYAFALRNMLATGHDGSVNRTAEKHKCESKVLDTSSCELPRLDGISPPITFWWKNYLGSAHEIAADDAARDVCHQMQTGSCLRSLFSGYNASDVLVVGSLPINITHFKAIGGSSFSSLEKAGPAFAAANAAADLPMLEQMLVHGFPGAILWHSYAYVDMARHTGDRSFDFNHCFDRISNATACALSRGRAGAGPSRMHFVDLRALERSRLSEYADAIHHPGKLSEAIVKELVRVASDMPS